MSRRVEQPDLLRTIFIVVVASLFLLCGGATFLLFGLSYHQSLTPFPDGVTTTGTVINIETSHSGSGVKASTTYIASYTFTTSDGYVKSFRDNVATSMRPAVGDQVTVSYRAGGEDARRVSGDGEKGWTSIAVGGGVSMICLYVILRTLWKYFRARRSIVTYPGPRPG